MKGIERLSKKDYAIFHCIQLPISQQRFTLTSLNLHGQKVNFPVQLGSIEMKVCFV